MGKLIVKLGLLVLSLLLTLNLLYRYINQFSSTSYFAAMIDKHHRAELFTGQSRLLLVGGSGTAFAIDSQLLEDSLHMPVINLGIHAGLGLPFMLREVQKMARSGDVVLLTPEYLLSHGDDYTQFFASEFYPPALNYMTFNGPYNYTTRRSIYYLKRIQNSLLVGVDDQRKAIISDTNSVYFRAGFSSRGDLISPLNNRRSVDIGKIQLIYRGYDTEIGLINAAAANMPGVTTLITYPALAQSQFLANELAISQYADQLKKLQLVKLIGTPERVMYPDSCFFDTPYHLGTTCRQNYSKQLFYYFKTLRNNLHTLKPIAVVH